MIALLQRDLRLATRAGGGFGLVLGATGSGRVKSGSDWVLRTEGCSGSSNMTFFNSNAGTNFGPRLDISLAIGFMGV